MKDVGFDNINSIPGIIRKRTPADAKAESDARKATPIFSGVMMYFGDALAAVAELSRKGNDKHNPGQPLHWSREKSNDHADCVARHLIDIGPDWTAIDHEDELLHAVKLAWRSLAVLQIAIERKRAVSQPTATAVPTPWPYPTTPPMTVIDAEFEPVK